MQDIRVHLEKLRVQVAECEMIRDLATDPRKRELFGRLAEHFKALAGELEQAITVHAASGSHSEPDRQKPLPKGDDCA